MEPEEKRSSDMKHELALEKLIDRLKFEVAKAQSVQRHLVAILNELHGGSEVVPPLEFVKFDGQLKQIGHLLALLDVCHVGSAATAKAVLRSL